MTGAVDVYSTFPRAADAPGDLLRHAADVARWTGAAGVGGLLLPAADGVDAWALAQVLLERSTGLVPLVEVDATERHPLTVARAVASLTSLYQRRIDLGLVAGGPPARLRAYGVFLDHDDRYARLTEFGQGVLALLSADKPVTHRGIYYEMLDAPAAPLPAGFTPRRFVAGSSAAAAITTRALGGKVLAGAEPAGAYAMHSRGLHGRALRLGVIARETGAEAARIARQRFPGAPAAPAGSSSPYRAHPAGRYAFLVGSYTDVGQYLARYLDLGLETLVLEPPVDEDDQHHAMEAVRRAWTARSPTSEAPDRDWPLHAGLPVTMGLDGRGRAVNVDTLSPSAADN